MPIGYHVTRLPVTIVIHNAYATHNTMVTDGLPLFSKLFWEILRKMPIGYHVTRLPVTYNCNAYAQCIFIQMHNYVSKLATRYNYNTQFAIVAKELIELLLLNGYHYS